MTVLITGSTGFIGTHLLEEMTGGPHRLRCLVRATSDLSAPRSSGAEIVVGDVTDRDSIRRAIEGCDAVIHLANIYDFWTRRKSEFEAVNVEGTRNVMLAALDAGVKKVVHVSTLVAYGDAADDPLTELSVAGSRFPSEYSRTKYEGERLAWELYRTQSLPLVVVYPGAATGAGDDRPSGRYIESIVKRKAPAQVLVDCGVAWVHVRDVARVILRALEKEGNIGERYFAAAEWFSFGGFNKLITEASGVRLPRLVMPNAMLLASAAVLSFLGRIFGFAPMLGMSLDQVRTMKLGCRADGSKATRELGITYEPIKVAVEEAVSRMVDNVP